MLITGCSSRCTGDRFVKVGWARAQLDRERTNASKISREVWQRLDVSVVLNKRVREGLFVLLLCIARSILHNTLHTQFVDVIPISIRGERAV